MLATVKKIFCEQFNDLMFLNLVTAAFFLPVVTIGPALLALNGTLIKILDKRCPGKALDEYMRLFKKKFWKGFFLELLVVLYGGVLLWCLSLSAVPGERGLILWALTIFVGFWAVMVAICGCAVLSCTQIGFWDGLWNGVCLALGRFPAALLSSAIRCGSVVICYLFYPISLLPFAILLLSVTEVLGTAALWPSIKELILDKCEE